MTHNEREELLEAYTESCLSLRRVQKELDEANRKMEGAREVAGEDPHLPGADRTDRANFERQLKLCIIYLADSLENAGWKPPAFCQDYVEAFRNERDELEGRMIQKAIERSDE